METLYSWKIGEDWTQGFQTSSKAKWIELFSLARKKDLRPLYIVVSRCWWLDGTLNGFLNDENGKKRFDIFD